MSDRPASQNPATSQGTNTTNNMQGSTIGNVVNQNSGIVQNQSGAGDNIGRDKIVNYNYLALFKQGISDPNSDLLQSFAEWGLKEFTELVQNDLSALELSSVEIRENYAFDIEKFIEDEFVLSILSKAFEQECRKLDAQGLESRWLELNQRAMPEGWNWQYITTQYVRRVQKYIKDNPGLREALDNKIMQSDIHQMAGVQPGFDLLKYRKSLLDQYGKLKLESIDSTGYAYNDLRLSGMFVAQNVKRVQEFVPQLYELPKEHQQKLQESGELDEDFKLQDIERLKKTYVEQPILPVLELVDDPAKSSREGSKLVILGDPGSGKSTLLQHIAVRWAELSTQELEKQRLPLLIELRKFAREQADKDCNGVLDYLHKGSNAVCHLDQHRLDEVLRTGEAIVMFDGLDEVFDPKQREDAIATIHRFTNNYPNVQVIVTSRVIGYKQQQLRDAGFEHYMLQDLELQQIEDFIQRWHDLTYDLDIERERKRERLRNAVTRSKAIRELAGNPLLLTLMAILNRHRELPRDRVQLYNRSAELLLYQWDIERALEDEKHLDLIAEIDFLDKHTMLRKVAYRMQASSRGLQGNIISRNDLEEIFKEYLLTQHGIDRARAAARVIIEQLRKRNFILCYLGADYYAFVHRTFLEYFCASEFTEKFTQEAISEKELKEEIFGQHWHDETWHEVLCLIAGLVSNVVAGRLIAYLMQQQGNGHDFANHFLAAKCLEEVRDRSVIATIDKQLLEQCQKLVGYFANPIYPVDEDDYNFDSENNKLVQKAVRAIALTWAGAIATLAIIKAYATKDRNWVVRLAAVQELARGWANDPDTLAILKARATEDDKWNVRLAAVQELARGWANDPDTLAWLKARATEDIYPDVRVAAVQELARGWANDPDTLAILKARANEDDNWNVRRAAVQELACGWANDPDTLAWLKARATEDIYPDVRVAAVQELARGWANDPDTLAILKARATEDIYPDVRVAAVQELARGWANDPDTLAWLKARATEDDKWNVRLAAVQELARGWANDPDTLAILKARATEDDKWNVRLAAVQELARGWANDPDTLAWLKARATEDNHYDVRYAAKNVIRQIESRK
jgi:predicted NACHT family NTPase